MFKPIAAVATLPAQDIERAKAFYSDKLGLKPTEESEQEAIYTVGDTMFSVFPSFGAPSGEHTQMGFMVEDIDATVTALRDSGVVFEEYDLPGLKTVNGIAELQDERAAWFKDSEGNVLAVGQRRED
jgi:catechol 2,3-dioxygenase-like lactoylglutathione lyase family enzyme